jgi:hypothetical protein
VIWIAPVLAAYINLQLERSDLSEGQSAQLQLVVTDANFSGVPDLKTPEGLSLKYQGQSQQFMAINMQTSVSTVYSYQLSALKEGRFVLGPYTLQTSAGILTTPALPVVVSQRAGSSSLDRLQAVLSSTSAWVGQILLYHLDFQTTRALVNAQWSPPQPVGLSTEGSLQPVTGKSEVLQPDGKKLLQATLDLAFRATTAGSRTLPGAILQAQFAAARNRGRGPLFGLDPFTDVQEEIFSASPIPVEIKPLPVEGKPADFSGLVGNFLIMATASQSRVPVGETVTLEIKLVGDAPLNGIKLPPLQGEGFRVYDDQPVTTAKIEASKIEASAIFKRAIVPQSPGTLTLPPTSFSYFDPSIGSYQTIQSQPVVLEVVGEAEQAQLNSFGTPAPKNIEVQGEDILPLRTTPNLSHAWNTATSYLLLLPGSLLLLGAGFKKLSGLKKAPIAVWRPDFSNLPLEPEARLAAVDAIFRRALAEKLGKKAEELHKEDLQELEVREEAMELYRLLELARYRGDISSELESRVKTLVEGL